MEQTFTLEKKGSNMFTLLIILITSLSWIGIIDCIVLEIGIEKYDIMSSFIIPNIILIIINTIYLYITMNKRVSMCYMISDNEGILKLVFNVIKIQLRCVIALIMLNISVNLIGKRISLDMLKEIYTPIRFYLFVVSWLLPIISYRSIDKYLVIKEYRYHDEIEKKKREMLSKEIDKNKQNYLQILEEMIQEYSFSDIAYEKNSLYKVIQGKHSKNIHSISLDLNDSKVSFNKNTDFVEEYTNDQKVESLNNQIENLKNKYNVLELSDIVKIISKNIPKYSSSDYQPNSFRALLNNNYDISFMNQLKSFKIDVEMYLNTRIKYLLNEYSSASLGYQGEKSVNEELDKYNNEFINIKNKIFDLDKIDFIDDKYVMECDNILITRYGIFVLEVKNRGVYSVYKNSKGRNYNRYKILVEPEGRWVKLYRDGSKEILNSNPVLQNRDHVIKVRDIINNYFGYTQDDKEYIDVKGIVVIANEDVDFKNNSRECIIRTKYIYNEITKNKRVFDKKQMNKFKEILDEYDSIEHSATKYQVINVFEEINNIDIKINEFAEQAKLKEIYDAINNIEKRYIQDEERIFQEINKVYRKQKNTVNQLNLSNKAI